jgi:hypothetical protein
MAHVISLVKSFHMQSGLWVVLPEYYTPSRTNSISITVADFVARSLNSAGASSRASQVFMSTTLLIWIIKPGHLLYDAAFRLQIADFDVSIQVEDEDEQVDVYHTW